MSKKTIVSSILMTNVPAFAAAFFRVGDVPLNAEGQPCEINEVPAFPPVKEIKFCRDRFGGGAIVDQPCYEITFEDAAEKVLVPANAFTQATVLVIDATTNDEPVPAMPA